MKENAIIMSEGAFGVYTVINITSPLILVGDILTIKIKANSESLDIISKDYTVTEKTGDLCTVNFSLTQEESEQLSAGYYIWGIEHTRSNALLQDLPLDEGYSSDFIVKKGV